MGALLFRIETVLVFLAMMMVLVAAHELGHYLFARIFRMGIEEFSIGMGGQKPLVVWFRKVSRIPLGHGAWNQTAIAPAATPIDGAMRALEGASANTFVAEIEDTPTGPVLVQTTEFTIRPWPIGGFVRIRGMLPEADGSEIRVPGGFYSRPPSQRFIVLLAGPMFSILTGVLVMVPLFMVQGREVHENKPVVQSLMPNGPAAKANLKEGDLILSVDGKPVTTFFDIVQELRTTQGKPLDLVYQRSGQHFQVTVTPELSKIETAVLTPDLEDSGVHKRQYLLGLHAPVRRIPVAFGEAVAAAMELPVADLKGIVQMIRRPAQIKNEVGGPLTMYAATSEAVSDGFASVIQIAALISISVGFMNLLPIFPLDGGQMMIAVAEMLRSGRRLSMMAQNVFGGLGLGLVALLVVSILCIDVGRVINKTPLIPPPASNDNVAPAKP